MKPPFLSHVFAALILFTACHVRGIDGDGQRTEEKRPIAEFTALQADGSYEIQWESGSPSLTLTADANLLSHIKTTVEKDRLTIREDTDLRPTQVVKVVLTSPSLAEVQLNGAAKTHLKRLAGERFTIDCNGAGDIVANGQVGQFHTTLNGSSEVHAFDLAAKSAEVTINGAGQAEVSAADHLKVTISGSGAVTYAGKPTVEQNIYGAGSVRSKP